MFYKRNAKKKVIDLETDIKIIMQKCSLHEKCHTVNNAIIIKQKTNYIKF